MRLFQVVVVLAALGAPARAGGVRIVHAPALGTFQDFQAAVDAAADGDELLVGGGTYGSVTIAGKGLWIVAVPGSTPKIQGTLTIQGLGQGQHVLVSGLHTYGATQDTLSDAGLIVENCQGHVRLQDCVFVGGYGAEAAYPGGEGGPGAVIESSPAVAFVRCTMKGGAGYDNGYVCYDCTGGQGGNGVQSDVAAVALYDCSALGGNGGRSGLQGGHGGHGYRLPSWGLFASGSHFQGGKGGNGEDFVIAYGGNGGHGLDVGGAQAQLLDNTYAGGAGGIAFIFPQYNGKPGDPIHNNGGVANQLPGSKRVFSGASLVSDASTTTFTLEGEPGDKLFLMGAKSPAFAFVASSSGTWLVPSPFFSSYRPHGVVPASGTLVLQLPTPNHTTPAERTYWQGLVVDAQGKAFLSSPLHQVALDRAGPPDCNASGVADWVEILEGTTPDCDENVVPDSCDPDCNTNGVPDGCDILQGASSDCNGNNVPDECDLASGASPDCNQNNVPDECDLAGGTSKDLNGNGLPDECESGVTWYVDAAAPPGGNGSAASPFQAIGHAIPTSVSGDTVLVADGTYTGAANREISFGGRDLVVRSQNGPANCIIDCENLGRAFFLKNGETLAARIEGLTIVNGNALAIYNVGGGIFVSSASVTIKDCRIDACFAQGDGGGIYAGGRVNILECIVSRCQTGTASSSGGGIYLNVSASLPNGATTVVRGTLVNNCTAATGGGIIVYTQRNVVISHCTISFNTATSGRGGGLRSTMTQTTNPLNTGLRVDNTRFISNTANEGGGLHVMGMAHLSNLTIVNNGAVAGAGGLHLWSNVGPVQGNVDLANSILWGNTAPVGPQIQLSGQKMLLDASFCDIQGGQAQIAVGPNGSLVWGAGNIDLDPLFASAQLKLGPASPCIDAGHSGLVSADWADIDGDGNTTEKVPLDLGLLPRVVDVPGVPDTGMGPPPIVDMGGYERQP